jgi:hypothetical protein
MRICTCEYVIHIVHINNLIYYEFGYLSGVLPCGTGTLLGKVRIGVHLAIVCEHGTIKYHVSNYYYYVFVLLFINLLVFRITSLMQNYFADFFYYSLCFKLVDTAFPK